MRNFNEEAQNAPGVLASDLDGTLIPLPGREENRRALDALRRAKSEIGFDLLYVTGRPFDSVARVREEEGLPDPDWIICDVGTSIYHQDDEGFHLFGPYRDHLDELTGGYDRGKVREALEGLDGLKLQADENQREFKISYECPSGDTETLGERISRILEERDIPYHVTTSVDPFLHRGLIDLLPEGTSKAYALNWISTHAGFDPASVVFAGDSGNDLAALISGFHAIVVANAADGLAELARSNLEAQNLSSRLYCASGRATSGVLEGCVHFGLIPDSYLPRT